MIFVQHPIDAQTLESAGQAIIDVSRSAFRKGRGNSKTAWQRFEQDPAKALHNWGYRLRSTGAPGDPEIPADGSIPSNLMRIVPVYDGPQTMHVRVPWTDFIDTQVIPPND